MLEIITETEKLSQTAEPVKFLSAEGIEAEAKETILDTVNKLTEVLNANNSIVAIAAPQIGIPQRIFCIKFKEVIKVFINPIITKKSKYVLGPETFASMPGKEILIARPDEITAIYYTQDFKYEENKFLGAAAHIFDQHIQLLDGILPSELGLVSDIEEDGSLSDLTEDEFKEVVEIYKQFIATKTKNIVTDVESDEELTESYKRLRFSETVINGRAAIVAKEPSSEHKKAAQATAAMSLKQNDKINKAVNRAQLATFLRRKGK